jgi:hypothetical protein
LLELEFDKAQRLHYSISVIRVSTPPVSKRYTRRLTTRFAEALRSTDVMTMTSDSSWMFLLAGADQEVLQPIIQRITGHLGPLSWSAGGASYPLMAIGVEDLLDLAQKDLESFSA